MIAKEQHKLKPNGKNTQHSPRSHDRVVGECALPEMRGREQLNTNMNPDNVHSAHVLVHVGQEEYCMKIAPFLEPSFLQD